MTLVYWDRVWWDDLVVRKLCHKVDWRLRSVLRMVPVHEIVIVLRQLWHLELLRRRSIFAECRSTIASFDMKILAGFAISTQALLIEGADCAIVC